MQGKRNLAHRMGRWSGMHPWTAIIGWVAFVASLHGRQLASRANTLGEADTGVGESGRATKVLDRAFTDASSPPRSTSSSRAGGQARRDRHPRRRRRRDASAFRRPASCRDQGGRALRERTAARLPFTVTGPHDAADKVAPIEDATKASPPHIRRFWSRASAMRPAASSSTTSSPGLPEGRDAVRPGHAGHPDRRLRRAARRRHPGAARPHLGVRGVRPDDAARASSSPTGESTQILMMLIGMAVGVDYSLFYLQAGARGARPRRRQAGRARGRRRHQRPRRARVRPDRDGLAGRHVPDRRRRRQLAWPSARSSSSAWPCSAR